MRRLLLIGVIAALGGCASQLHEVNESLRRANASMAGATSSARSAGQLGDGSGYQPVINVAVPVGVCHPQAYVDGFKDSYLVNWNQYVSTKVSQYSAEAMRPNANPAAKQNLALYKSKLIGTKKYVGHAPDYKMDVSSFGATNCPYQSYQQGQSAGVSAVSSDWKALIAQEL